MRDWCACTLDNAEIDSLYIISNAMATLKQKPHCEYEPRVRMT